MEKRAESEMNQMRRTKAALVGCGMISEKYLDNITTLFRNIEVVGAFDVSFEAAEARAKQFGIKKVYKSYEELLDDHETEIVLNLTNPAFHYELNKKALLNGKHVYVEKPLAATYAQSAELLDIAKSQGKTIGCSPDTVLGASIQTARKLIEDGYIGEVIGGTLNLFKFGVETWHPSPEFLYQPGAGPLHDMGPYYLSSLIHLVGPVTEVVGMSRISFKTRTITSKPKYGQTFEVNVPTHVSSLLKCRNNVFINFNASFDVQKASLPRIEIFGTEGTISVDDPNVFSSKVQLYREEKGEFLEIPETFSYSENCRGLGFADLVGAIKTGRQARANGEVAAHVIDILDSILLSAKSGTVIKLHSGCEKPPLMNHKIVGNFEE